MKYLLGICWLLLLQGGGMPLASAQQPTSAQPSGEHAEETDQPQGLSPEQVRQLPAASHNQELTLRQSWCLEHDGQVNVILFNRLRCDCLTATHAIRFTSPQTWNEALGPILHTAMITGRQPGLVVFTTGEPRQDVLELLALIKYYNLPVTLWTQPIDASALNIPEASPSDIMPASGQPPPGQQPPASPTPMPSPTPSEFLMNDLSLP